MELTLEQRLENRRLLEEKLKDIDFFIRPIQLEFKNFENKDQRKLSKLIYKYETVITNIRKKKLRHTQVRDYNIQKCIRGGFNECLEEGHKPSDVTSKWVLTIQNMLKPVKELYKNRKIEINEKQKLMNNEKIHCDICNGKYTHTNKLRHFSSEKHVLAEKNKTEGIVGEKIEEIKNASDKITCECGIIHTRVNKSRHSKSKHHIDYINTGNINTENIIIASNE
jgi:hypothetical protein